MGFVVAVRGKSRVRVSENVYNNVYKKRGYRLVNQGINQQQKGKKQAAQEGDAKQSSSVPISDMNESELKAYAWEHDIDITNAKTVGELRKTIQKARQI